MSQKAEEGWIEWNGARECPIKDRRTVLEVEWSNGKSEVSSEWDNVHYWTMDPRLYITAYRIIEAHGADAASARPTPFPQSYADLVFDDAGWSQTIIVDGKRPEWLRDDDRVSSAIGGAQYRITGLENWIMSIRVRRRETKRETVTCLLISSPDQPPRFASTIATIDLIDGKPDLSTLKIAEDAL